MIHRPWSAAVACVATALLAGCTHGPAPSGAATRPVPATDVPPVQAYGEYWYKQPATHVVPAGDFDALWNAAEAVARDHLFRIDRRDHRDGVLTTEPLTGKQFFEFWRPDIATLGDVAQSSLTTVRRTLRFEFHRQDDGAYAVAPKVLVEQLAVVGQRITAVAEYHSVFDPGQQQGSLEQDEGRNLPQTYWYALGRDEAMEKVLTEAIERKLRR